MILRGLVVALAQSLLLGTAADAQTGQKPAADPDPVKIEETVVVTATRSGGRIDDQPTRVEVLTREEVEEKMMMTPGDIVMMLNEMGGMRVQTTSSSMGAASVRIQGMKGRYTRVLFDGLPLAGQQVGGLGLLQIPPMDLGHVEVIKGVASALYGAGAMGGVINLVARRPQATLFSEVLFNQSTTGTTDGIAFLSSPIRPHVGATLLAGVHHQVTNDIDDDGWNDLAGYSRGVLRPRVFWDDGKGGSGSATFGLTVESRTGGPDIDGPLYAQTGGVESVDTKRFDLGGGLQRVVSDRFVVTARAATTMQWHDHLYFTDRERDLHINVFGEAAVRGEAGRHSWVGGVAFERESLDAQDTPRFEYFHRAPGIFGQDEIRWTDWATISASARLDLHHTYGAFFSPRVSVLLRHDGWTSRASIGRGFFASTPITEETEAAGLTRLSMPAPLDAETATSYSVDVTHALGIASITGTLFGASVQHQIVVDRESSYEIRNSDGPGTTTGFELLGTLRQPPFALTGTYSLVRSREDHNGTRVRSALTPTNGISLVGTWEREGLGRLGLEYYFTGSQRLEANPYRDQSAAYSILGAMAERKVGPIRVFVNTENLTNVRQTSFDPLVRPSQAIDGRWTVDAWAPLDGRTLNAGIRATF
ncbi:MAG: TonB-dependent receptor [Acidobacteriota bacterium]